MLADPLRYKHAEDESSYVTLGGAMPGSGRASAYSHCRQGLSDQAEEYLRALLAPRPANRLPSRTLPESSIFQPRR